MSKIGVIGSLNMDTIIQVEKMPEEGENIFLETIKIALEEKAEMQLLH